ncbi:MAG: cytochrome P450 [Gammaproteobacteria bacterium]|nr:cytochrome P450 [Gammaproteobacteria bacterium]
MSETEQAGDLDIEPFAPDQLRHPYAGYKVLRDRAPVYKVPELGLHLVTRYDLVREALKDTATFSSEFDDFLAMAQQMTLATLPADVRARIEAVNAEMITVPPTMLTLDEPGHTRYRSLVSQLFTGSEIRRGEAMVQAIIDHHLQRFLDSGETDFIAGFAFAVPLRIIADRLGIPDSERDCFEAGAKASAAGLRLTAVAPETLLQRAEAARDLQRLLLELLADRRRQPQADMISVLAHAELEGCDRPLTDPEALSILGQFLVAGHETTTSTLGWGMLMLCRDPGLQEQLREEPALLKTFVEEVLRLESPVQGLPRVVTRDTELGGYPLQAGELVMLRYGAANRDERQFVDPDALDVHRDKAGMQMAFGSGIHHCIGAPLARQELSLGFAAVLRAMREIRLHQGFPEPEAEASFILRNLPELHIAYQRS